MKKRARFWITRFISSQSLGAPHCHHRHAASGQLFRQRRNALSRGETDFTARGMTARFAMLRTQNPGFFRDTLMLDTANEPRFAGAGLIQFCR